MAKRERYAVEDVAKSVDRTAADIDQIEAEGWSKLGSYLSGRPPAIDEFPALHCGRDTLAMMKDRNIHPDATT
jgi:hypothetical protein